MEEFFTPHDPFLGVQEEEFDDPFLPMTPLRGGEDPTRRERTPLGELTNTPQIRGRKRERQQQPGTPLQSGDIPTPTQEDLISTFPSLHNELSFMEPIQLGTPQPFVTPEPEPEQQESSLEGIEEQLKQIALKDPSFIQEDTNEDANTYSFIQKSLVDRPIQEDNDRGTRFSALKDRDRSLRVLHKTTTDNTQAAIRFHGFIIPLDYVWPVKPAVQTWIAVNDVIDFSNFKVGKTKASEEEIKEQLDSLLEAPATLVFPTHARISEATQNVFKKLGVKLVNKLKKLLDAGFALEYMGISAAMRKGLFLNPPYQGVLMVLYVHRTVEQFALYTGMYINMDRITRTHADVQNGKDETANWTVNHTHRMRENPEKIIIKASFNDELRKEVLRHYFHRYGSLNVENVPRPTSDAFLRNLDEIVANVPAMPPNKAGDSSQARFGLEMAASLPLLSLTHPELVEIPSRSRRRRRQKTEEEQMEEIASMALTIAGHSGNKIDEKQLFLGVSNNANAVTASIPLVDVSTGEDKMVDPESTNILDSKAIATLRSLTPKKSNVTAVLVELFVDAMLRTNIHRLTQRAEMMWNVVLRKRVQEATTTMQQSPAFSSNDDLPIGFLLSPLTADEINSLPKLWYSPVKTIDFLKKKAALMFNEAKTHRELTDLLPQITFFSDNILRSSDRILRRIHWPPISNSEAAIIDHEGENIRVALRNIVIQFLKFAGFTRDFYRIQKTKYETLYSYIHSTMMTLEEIPSIYIVWQSFVDMLEATDVGDAVLEYLRTSTSVSLAKKNIKDFHGKVDRIRRPAGFILPLSISNMVSSDFAFLFWRDTDLFSDIVRYSQATLIVVRNYLKRFNKPSWLNQTGKTQLRVVNTAMVTISTKQLVDALVSVYAQAYLKFSRESEEPMDSEYAEQLFLGLSTLGPLGILGENPLELMFSDQNEPPFLPLLEEEKEPSFALPEEPQFESLDQPPSFLPDELGGSDFMDIEDVDIPFPDFIPPSSSIIRFSSTLLSKRTRSTKEKEEDQKEDKKKQKKTNSVAPEDARVKLTKKVLQQIKKMEENAKKSRIQRGEIRWKRAVPSNPIRPASSAIHDAVINTDHTQLDTLLQDKTVNINEQHTTKRLSPLYYAALQGNFKAAQKLIDAGADVDLQSANGKTPLYAAVEHKNYKVVNLLLDKGADTELATEQGWTPLHQAAFKDDLYAVKSLLIAKANKNAKIHTKTPTAYEGKTPFDLVPLTGINSRRLRDWLSKRSTFFEDRKRERSPPPSQKSRRGIVVSRSDLQTFNEVMDELALNKREWDRLNALSEKKQKSKGSAFQTASANGGGGDQPPDPKKRRIEQIEEQSADLISNLPEDIQLIIIENILNEATTAKDPGPHVRSTIDLAVASPSFASVLQTKFGQNVIKEFIMQQRQKFNAYPNGKKMLDFADGLKRDYLKKQGEIVDKKSGNYLDIINNIAALHDVENILKVIVRQNDDYRRHEAMEAGKGLFLWKTIAMESDVTSSTDLFRFLIYINDIISSVIEYDEDSMYLKAKKPGITNDFAFLALSLFFIWNSFTATLKDSPKFLPSSQTAAEVHNRKIYQILASSFGTQWFIRNGNFSEKYEVNEDAALSELYSYYTSMEEENVNPLMSWLASTLVNLFPGHTSNGRIFDPVGYAEANRILNFTDSDAYRDAFFASLPPGPLSSGLYGSYRRWMAFLRTAIDLNENVSHLFSTLVRLDEYAYLRILFDENNIPSGVESIGRLFFASSIHSRKVTNYMRIASLFIGRYFGSLYQFQELEWKNPVLESLLEPVKELLITKRIRRTDAIQFALAIGLKQEQYANFFFS